MSIAPGTPESSASRRYRFISDHKAKKSCSRISLKFLSFPPRACPVLAVLGRQHMY
jgi:hypothetical protein